MECGLVCTLQQKRRSLSFPVQCVRVGNTGFHKGTTWAINWIVYNCELCEPGSSSDPLESHDFFMCFSGFIPGRVWSVAALDLDRPHTH